MQRYKFLSKEYVYEALNKLRSAFLAAKDGKEVDEIIMGVLTNDERIKIGRRIQIAQMLKSGLTYFQIKEELKVGVPTITLVHRKINEHPLCYELISERDSKVVKEYKTKAYETQGGSKLIFKKKAYTGFQRKDVKR